MLLGCMIYAGVFFPLLNADQGIYAMMTRHFNSRHGMYFWGQDRFGGLLPLLAAPFTKFFPAMVVLSIFQMGINFGGWYFWSRNLQSRFGKIALALVFIIPPILFCTNVIFAQPYHILLLLWGAAFYIVKRETLSTRQLALAGFILGISFWVSETSISALLMMAIMIWRKMPFWKTTAAMALGLLVPTIIVVKSKLKSVKVADFSSQFLVDAGELNTNFHRISHGILKNLQPGEPERWAILWAHYGMLIIGLIIFIISIISIPRFFSRSEKFQYPLFFLFWGSLGLALLSHWVFLNDTSVRYFAILYPLGMTVMLMWAEKHFLANVIRTFVFFIALLGAGDAAHIIATNRAEILPDRMTNAEAKSFPIEPGATYIGDYWNVYLLGGYGSRNERFFSYAESYTTRNFHQLRGAFEDQPVFLIGNDWLEEFPDTVVQFRYTLVRVGETQWHNTRRYAEYRVISVCL